MSEVYDNSEFNETQRNTQHENEFPLHEENVQVDEDVNDMETVYEQLTLFEKLKDDRWQVRRKGYSELYDFFKTGKPPSNLEDDSELLPEHMVPWIQNMIAEPNMIALVEALKALNT